MALSPTNGIDVARELHQLTQRVTAVRNEHGSDDASALSAPVPGPVAGSCGRVQLAEHHLAVR